MCTHFPRSLFKIIHYHVREVARVRLQFQRMLLPNADANFSRVATAAENRVREMWFKILSNDAPFGTYQTHGNNPRKQIEWKSTVFSSRRKIQCSDKRCQRRRQPSNDRISNCFFFFVAYQHRAACGVSAFATLVDVYSFLICDSRIDARLINEFGYLGRCHNRDANT